MIGLLDKRSGIPAPQENGRYAMCTVSNIAPTRSPIARTIREANEAMKNKLSAFAATSPACPPSPPVTCCNVFALLGPTTSPRSGTTADAEPGPVDVKPETAAVTFPGVTPKTDLPRIRSAPRPTESRRSPAAQRSDRRAPRRRADTRKLPSKTERKASTYDLAVAWPFPLTVTLAPGNALGASRRSRSRP